MERRDPVWRWAGTFDWHGRHGDPDFLFVHLFLIFNRQSSSVSKCKNVHNCLNKTDYWGKNLNIYLDASCDYFNKSNNNIIIVIIRILYIYICIYRSVALRLVLSAEFGPRRKLIEEPCCRVSSLEKVWMEGIFIEIYDIEWPFMVHHLEWIFSSELSLPHYIMVLPSMRRIRCSLL